MVAHSSLWGPRGDTCAHDESMRTVWRSKRSQTGRGLRLGFLRRNPPVHLATIIIIIFCRSFLFFVFVYGPKLQPSHGGPWKTLVCDSLKPDECDENPLEPEKRKLRAMGL